MEHRPDWAAAMPRWARLLLGTLVAFVVIQTVMFVVLVIVG